MKKMTRMLVLTFVMMVAVCSGCDDEEKIVYLYPDGAVVEDDAYGEEGEEGEPSEVCVPDCEGRECGDDGCGGSCGTCESGDTCSEGTCVSACAQCTDEQCGWQLSSCEANWECGALLSCLSKCGSDSCVESCVYSYMGGAEDLMDLLECMDSYCSSDC